MASVKLEGITKRYEDVTAVDDMNLGIEDGEFVTFVGPSGCGKSTTMETIAGLTLPTEGTIEIGGRDVTDLPPKDRGISMVFQNIALFPHMDVYDNISFGLRLRKYDQEEVDRRVEEAADIVADVMDLIPKYTRLQRVQRDIPADFIDASVQKSNLRQLAAQRAEEKGIVQRDISAREVGHNDADPDPDDVELSVTTYEAGGGTEHFIAFEDPVRD
ncbi:ATP-binding cassette domain-containing protein, partial [Halorubrum ezzemoulense]|uniref:ATP-binding cassette domain-containing protein n=1 Tax=Halorubrum ezzemoulense TaxID=337243 RepID=UPI0023314412